VLEEQGMPVARLWPHLVAALVPMRSGTPEGAPHLDEAWELAGRIDEPLRRLPVLSALAERIWMSSAVEPHVVDDAVADLKRLTGAPGSEWALGELGAWLLRLGLIEKPPTPVAEPFRLAGASAAAGEHPCQPVRADQPPARRRQAGRARVHQRRDRQPPVHLAEDCGPSRLGRAQQARAPEPASRRPARADELGLA
jgi:hypothetical protein